MIIKKKEVEKWGVFEVELEAGKEYSRPFEDVSLSAVFENDGKRTEIQGFYDGNKTWKIRFMPEKQGIYKFSTMCNDKDLNGLTGSFKCIPPSEGNHGSIKVDKGMHFSYADGSPCFVMGTTAYAWTYMKEEMRKKTLESFKKYDFNKIRMLFFPKHLAGMPGIDLTHEPPCLPYEGEKNNFDYRSFNLEYFRNFEDRVMDLLKLGIEADVILFHNYDFGMWGIDDNMNDDEGIFYIDYLLARIGAYRNVWWSLANEYDLYKDPDGGRARSKLDRRDWDRIGKFLMDNDPYNHPRSIHNWAGPIYPDRDWLTHVSYQNSNTYSLILDCRYRYKKPVIADEYRYEGNLPYAWGNMTWQQETLSQWLSVMAGGYGTHGECYIVDGNIKDIFWTYGGEMVGKSAGCFKYLKEIVETLPFQEMKPDVQYGDCRYNYKLNKGTEAYLFLIVENERIGSVGIGPLDGRKKEYDMTVYDILNCKVTEEFVSEKGKGWIDIKTPGMIAVKAVERKERETF